MGDILIPNATKHDVVTFNILIEGKDISSLYQVLSISVIKEMNRIPITKIVLRDGEVADRTFAASEKNDFVPGNKIKINIGRDGTNTQFFEGIITAHSIKVRQNGNGELHIECRDKAVRMTIGRHSHYFEKLKDSQVFEQLISSYQLKPDVQATTLVHKELVQHHITDWDFLLLRAEANAMLVNVDDGTIHISKPKASTPALQVTYGVNIYEFEAEMDARSQLKSIEAKAWDYKAQNLFNAETSSSSFSEFGNITGSDMAKATSPDKYSLHHSGHRIEQELKDWVDGMMFRSRLAKIRGRARFQGYAGVKPGDTVKIDGVGARFNGNAFVTAVKHDLNNGIWDTHIQFGLKPEPYAIVHDNDLNDPETAGLIGSVHGLQIGKTVQLQSDPDGEDRILVKIPVIDNNAKGIWMRVASLDAGNQRGAFFRPEIGDEVIVGFINDDPRDAVVLGMLHSSAKSAPITAKDANDEKGFTTRSKMHISFNDQTKTITIDTPAGNSIILDEQGTKIEIKDQNSNKITMNSSGIKMESPLDIEIKAGANLKLEATASLSLKGLTASLKADTDVSVEGTTAALKGNVMTQVNGGIVKIN